MTNIKIVKSKTKTPLTFADVPVGNLFRKGDDVCLKISNNPAKEYHYNAYNLDANAGAAYDPTMKVTAVTKSTLTIG